MQPVWFQKNAAEDTQDQNINREPPATNLSYEPIPTSGFADWIGQDLDEFEKTYGRPEESMASGFSFTIHRYLVEDEFLEINTEDEVIKSIKYLGGENEQIEPFNFGMTMDELAEITMIYPNFTIEQDEKTIDLELEEEDMNYRPLIAFDNDSFAILFFDQNQESQLYAIDYLDEETLLKLAPYPIANEESPKYNQETDHHWEEIDQFKNQQTMELIQILREKDEQSMFSIDPNLQNASEDVLQFFSQNKEDVLTTERLQELQRFKQDEPGAFTLNDTEMDVLLQEIEDPLVSGHLELPVYDPSFSVLSWYSTPLLHEQMMSDEASSLAVAFSKEDVLILWREMEQAEESNSY